MSWLFEDPTYVLILGVAVEVGLLIALVRTGQKLFIGLLLAGLLLFGGLVLLERLVVTDRERVEETLYGAAAALEANNPAALVQFLSPSAGSMRDAITAVAEDLKVDDARITSDIEITFNQLTNPPQATATFIGRLDATYDRIKVPPVARLRVGLKKEGERWLVHDYELLDDLGGRGR